MDTKTTVTAVGDVDVIAARAGLGDNQHRAVSGLGAPLIGDGQIAEGEILVLVIGLLGRAVTRVKGGVDEGKARIEKRIEQVMEHGKYPFVSEGWIPLP